MSRKKVDHGGNEAKKLLREKIRQIKEEILKAAEELKSSQSLDDDIMKKQQTLRKLIQTLETIALRFPQAAQSIGVPPVRLMLRHLLPNLAGVILVYLTLTVPAVVLYESFLSFLGLGIRPPQASLGTLIADGASQLNPVRVRWWLLVFPAGLMALLLAALNAMGEGLRSAFEPRDED